MTARIPTPVIGPRSLACQGAADAASQASEGLPLRTLAFLPPLPWNGLVESPFRLGRVAWRYTPRIRQCVGRSRLSACAQVLSPPFPQSSSARHIGGPLVKPESLSRNARAAWLRSHRRLLPAAYCCRRLTDGTAPWRPWYAPVSREEGQGSPAAVIFVP